MNWFRRKKQEKGDRSQVIGDRETATQPLSPTTYQLSPKKPGTSHFSLLTSYSKFRLFTPVLLVLFAFALWLVPRVALASTNYTATQTSDVGARTTADTLNGDTCSSGSCSIGGGFNAGTKTSTAVSGTGSGASVGPGIGAGVGMERLDIFLTKTLDNRDNFIHKEWYS